MPLDALLPILSAIGGVMIGGFLTHMLSTKRDIAVKRRELILTNLIQALDELTRASSDRPDTDLKQLERAFARVLMFGNKQMVDLTRKAIIEISTIDGKVNLTPLHLTLRDEIRDELGLERLPPEFIGLVVRYLGDKGFDEEAAKRAAKR